MPLMGRIALRGVEMMQSTMEYIPTLLVEGTKVPR